jgi:hypothetical protein
MKAMAAKIIGDECMGLHVRRAARRITRMYDEALSAVDLTIGQFSLLTVLAGQERWAMQPLADVLGTDRSSLTAMLKPLERRELVTSEVDESDRRSPDFRTFLRLKCWEWRGCWVRFRVPKCSA